jgi:outer membrane protein assembly factor BamB
MTKSWENAMRACWRLVIGSIGLLSVSPLAGQEWARFRGPNGSGISAARAIPVRWTEKDYHWKIEVPGVGHSSPVLWGERLFVTCADKKTGARMLLCLRAADGHQLWARTYPGERSAKHTDSSPASATPAVDERHVYVSWGSPRQLLVVAVDHAGKETWRANLGPFRTGYGLGASPIIVGDLLAVPNDQDGRGALVGLDRRSGKIRWKVPRRSKASYTTPCVLHETGRPAELIFTNYEHGVTSIDPSSGRVNWEADIFHKGHLETAIGSPVVADDLVISTCGWLGVRQEVIAVRPGGRGRKPAVVYRIDRSVPLCTTPLVKGDLLFLWSDRGIVTCADARTGRVHWRERVPGTYYGSPVCIGDRLYSMSREGEVIVLAAAAKYRLLARNPLGEGSHATPAVKGGVLYLRTFSHVLAVGGKEAKGLPHRSRRAN